MSFTYETMGTCSKQIKFDLDGNVVHNVQFVGGCPGNIQGISRLVEGLTVDKVEMLLKGIKCGVRPTSCPDQLATAVRTVYDKENK